MDGAIELPFLQPAMMMDESCLEILTTTLCNSFHLIFLVHINVPVQYQPKIPIAGESQLVEEFIQTTLSHLVRL